MALKIHWHEEAVKLHNALEKRYGTAVADAIAYPDQAPLPVDADDEAKAAWVKHIVAALDSRFDQDEIRAIRSQCNCRNRMDEMRSWLGGIFRESHGLEDFVEKVNKHGAGWYLEDRAIHTFFSECACPMLAQVDFLPSSTWCECSRGYSRELFESVFNCRVDAELTRCVKAGDAKCEVVIRPDFSSPPSDATDYETT
ncbi:MAG: DUF6144 family protein [Planctomycetes bacterium]|nr:DUF6144 family protein [Planctomycetota bacterium]